MTFSFTLWSYHLVGHHAERLDKPGLKALQADLMRADWPTRAAAFRSAIWVASAIAAGVGLVLGTIFGLITPLPTLAKPLPAILLATAFGGVSYLIAPVLLRNAGNERGKEIDENLPHGLNYMLALANAGLPPRDVWASLARATVFGPLAVEAERIVRDLDFFGLDLLTALRRAQARTPSKRFSEFIVGAVSAFQSGVELESYLLSKGTQYQREAVETQLETIDTMGLMAEAFLVVVVAAPLFLIILLTVMSINQGRAVIYYGYAMALVFIPLTQIIIGTLVRSMNPRVWT